MIKILAPVFAASLSLSLLACSSDTANPGPGGGGGSGGTGSGGAGGGNCQKFDYANYKAPAGQLTLRKDVMPIFLLSCALASSCHSTGSIHPPNLGPQGGNPDAGIDNAALMAILTGLNGPAQQVPTLNYISPGKPEDSYLMNKIDGTANCMGFDCKTADKCGVTMPQSSPPLEAARIETIRAWIKQGATAM